MGEVSCGITLLSVDEVRELGGISQEEDGCVIGDDIPVAFIGPHLDSEATRITSQVMRSGLASDSREADSDWAFLALGAEDIGGCEFWNGVCALEVAVSATALGVNDALGDTLAVEV